MDGYRRDATSNAAITARRAASSRSRIARADERLAAALTQPCPFTLVSMANRQVVEAYARALADNDADAFDALLSDDYVGRYPQSGEVIRGPAGLRAIAEHFPGLETGGRLSSHAEQIVGADDQFVTGPSWNLIHLSGSGDEFSIRGTVTYPNGETWHSVVLLTLRGGKIWREIDYFGPPFERPDWRASITELETG
jgi:SnoaL-like domain